LFFRGLFHIFASSKLPQKIIAMRIVFSAPHYHVVSFEELSVGDKVFSTHFLVGTVIKLYGERPEVKYGKTLCSYNKFGFYHNSCSSYNKFGKGYSFEARDCKKIVSSTDEALNLPTIPQDRIDEYKLNELTTLLRLFEGDYMLYNIETQRPVERIDTVYNYESVIEKVNNGFKLKDNEMFVRMADLPLNILQEYAKETSEKIKNYFPHLLA